MLFLPFLATSNTWLVYSTSEYRKDFVKGCNIYQYLCKILILDVDFVKGYNIYQYLFGIQLCCIHALAKCWKSSKM